MSYRTSPVCLSQRRRQRALLVHGIDIIDRGYILHTSVLHPACVPAVLAAMLWFFLFILDGRQ